MAVVVDISMSLDGYVTGPDDGLGRGLGQRGEPIHNWVMGGPWTYGGGTPFQAAGVDREVLTETFAPPARSSWGAACTTSWAGGATPRRSSGPSSS